MMMAVRIVGPHIGACFIRIIYGILLFQLFVLGTRAVRIYRFVTGSFALSFPGRIS